MTCCVTGSGRRAVRPERAARRRGRARVAVVAAACLVAGCHAGAVAANGSDVPTNAPVDATASWSRVIVELRAARSPGGPDAARGKSIADARADLLAALPPGQFRVARSYETIPYVALEVSPAGLAALRASPLAGRIDPDRAVTVQGERTPGGTPRAEGPDR
ncbi:MAG TPA: hypothetical protein VFD92_04415 [Candidatus Binatia bacterium]|nr:hypothetical protein [Candidatus Binatia bacterium]